MKSAVKKHVPAKHAAKKSAAKKAAAKKAAAKKAAAKKAAAKQSIARKIVHSISEARQRMEEEHAELGMAYHHLQRAGAVISLLDRETGGDLRSLLEHGIALYRDAARSDTVSRSSVRCASGLLRAAEHLGMAGLYSARRDSARREYRVEVSAPSLAAVEHHVATLDKRLDGVPAKQKKGLRLLTIARELLRRAVENREDKHLRYELVMAADGICSALEAGL